MSIGLVREYLSARGMAERIMEFEQSTATVYEAAETLGVEPARIAKTLAFRNKAGDILVKVLFCEREQRLVEAVGEPVNGCYYRWADLRKFLESQL